MKIRVHANALTRGMSFNMFKAECFVISAEKNKIGQTTVRFAKSTSGFTDNSSIVVTPDFLFTLH